MLTALEKAQDINNDFVPFGSTGPINYRGAIAEIGVGQEVARTFFEALGTSKTIVKTMSAFAKSCSDRIYGAIKSRGGYVSRPRLIDMLDHDYELLVERSLTEDERPKNQMLRYFTFANTVEEKHGWAGVRVQTSGDSLSDGRHDVVEYRIHFNLLEGDKKYKMQVAGKLGVNLIHSALKHSSDQDGQSISDKEFVVSLVDDIETTAVRIDAIEIVRREYNVVPHKDKFGETARELECSDAELSIQQLDKQSSREMGAEIVKNSLSHCACFSPEHAQYGSATYAYDTFDYLSVPGIPRFTPRPLLIIRSSCETPELPLENEMFHSAKRTFTIDIKEDYGVEVSEHEIATAIQLPVLSVATKDAEPDVYIDRDREPHIHKQNRINILTNVDSQEISKRLDRIIESGFVAILTEFIATSELVKFLRMFTRMNSDAIRARLTQEELTKDREKALDARNIGFVVRTDHFIEMLLNFKERFKDRDAMEVIGNLVRRRVRIYLYPCTYGLISSPAAMTRYATPLMSAFSEKANREVSKWLGNNVTMNELKVNLDDKYSSLVKILDSAHAIRDVTPLDTTFCKWSSQKSI